MKIHEVIRTMNVEREKQLRFEEAFKKLGVSVKDGMVLAGEATDPAVVALLAAYRNSISAENHLANLEVEVL